MLTLILASIWTALLKVSPLVSSVIVILIFIISQLLANWSRRNELRRSWYFKAYFDVSLKKLEDFFQLCNADVKKSLIDLKEIQDGNDKITHVTKTLENISDRQRDFNTQVLLPLMGAYPRTFKNIGIILDNFYDIHSEVFDTPVGDKDPYKEYLEKLALIRTNLMTFLAVPVLENKESKNLLRAIEEENRLTNDSKHGVRFTIFISAIVLILISYAAWSYFPEGSPVINKKLALIAAQSNVKQKLLSPATADFDSEGINGVRKLNNSIYFVKSFVDSQNIYGANVRTYFECEIHADTINGTFKCIKLKLRP